MVSNGSSGDEATENVKSSLSENDLDTSKSTNEGVAETKRKSSKVLSGLQARIAAFNESARKATDPKEMMAKISDKSDRKKYNFAGGLKRDLEHTRAALRACAEEENDPDGCTFGHLFKFTEGRIANLNRILQNLKKAKEVEFDVEIFFEGKDDDKRIAFTDKFWDGKYTVDVENVFRPGRNHKDVPEEDRKGRSYVKDNLSTKDVKTCTVCDELVKEIERLTIRDRVYHMRCVKCAICGASPREKADFVTFDGNICCSAECIGKYDAAHLNQSRG